MRAGKSTVACAYILTVLSYLFNVVDSSRIRSCSRGWQIGHSRSLRHDIWNE